MSTISYRGMKLRVPSEVYKPDKDTYLLADNLEVEKGEKVLELGTGCGLISILAAESGAYVVATDINPKALECAEENAEAREIRDKIEFRTGDLFEPVKNEKFDLIIFNPPYLPTSSDESLGTELELAWDGGLDGRKVIDKFLNQVPDHLNTNGRFYFVQSSLSGVQETLENLDRKDLQIETKSEKVSFEKLYLFKVNLSS